MDEEFVKKMSLSFRILVSENYFSLSNDELYALGYDVYRIDTRNSLNYKNDALIILLNSFSEMVDNINNLNATVEMLLKQVDTIERNI